MINNELLQKAISIAVEAHRNQTREDESPYILHPNRVMMKMSTIAEKIVAILHDTIEDTDITLAYLVREGFAEDIQILEPLKLVSRNKSTSYDIYIESLSKNQIARKVKMADLEDNLNVLEMPKLDEYRLKRVKKYYDAYMFLKKVQNA